MTTNREVLTELLVSRGMPREHASIGADLFCEMVEGERLRWGDEPRSGGMGYEVVARLIGAGLEMVLERLPKHERERFKGVVGRSLS